MGPDTEVKARAMEILGRPDENGVKAEGYGTDNDRYIGTRICT